VLSNLAHALEKSIENPHFIFCSSFPSLFFAGSIHFITFDGAFDDAFRPLNRFVCDLQGYMQLRNM